MHRLIAFSLLIAVAFCTYNQDIPIPPKVEGYARGSATPKLHLEAYYDLLCPGSQNQWNILEPLLNSNYNINTNETLRFTIHLFPLPYHIHSFIFTQGAQVIADHQTQSTDIFNYFNLIFQNQNTYQTDVTAGLSQKAIHESITQLVTGTFPYTIYYFQDTITYGNNFDSEARVTWKYGTANRVTGTPTFFANGVEIDGAYAFEAQDWINFINGGYADYINKARARKMRFFDF